MSTYMPDRWLIVEISVENSLPFRKVLAGWSGGYLNSDEWRMSSVIIDVIEHDDHFEVRNESGSVYSCMKRRTGTTGLSASVLKRVLSQHDPDNGFNVSVVEIESLLDKK